VCAYKGFRSVEQRLQQSKEITRLDVIGFLEDDFSLEWKSLKFGIPKKNRTDIP
jgi:hypothetical protein